MKSLRLKGGGTFLVQKVWNMAMDLVIKCVVYMNLKSLKIMVGVVMKSWTISLMSES